MNLAFLWDKYIQSSFHLLSAPNIGDICLVVVIVARKHVDWLSTVGPLPLKKQCIAADAVRWESKVIPCQVSELSVLIPQAEAEDLTGKNKSFSSTVGWRWRQSWGTAAASTFCQIRFWAWRRQSFWRHMIRNKGKQINSLKGGKMKVFRHEKLV